MIQRLSHVTVYVLDQESAREFYVDKLGLELRADVRMGDFRWLTVGPRGQPGFEMVLMPVGGPKMSKEQADSLRALIAQGTFGVGVLETADCKKSYEELKARGVEFIQAPEARPYAALEAIVRDDSGNFFSLTQRT